MSIEDLKEFGKKISEDKAAQERVKNIGLDLEELMAFGRELGLEFDGEDMKALAAEAGVTEDELTEEQLEMVAGGCITATGAGAGSVLVAIAVTGRSEDW